MRIAQIASLNESVPPKKYGGTERVIYHLTEELVKMGHDVTLFASGDSVTSAKLHSIHPTSLRLAGLSDPKRAWLTYTLAEVYKMQDQFDIIHDHTAWQGMLPASLSKTPAVITLHGPILMDDKAIFNGFKDLNFVTISDAQRKPAPDLNFVGTVYNGIINESYPFSSKHEGYLLFVGRFSKVKGAHIAIQVAKFLKLPLIIAAKLDDCDKEYFQKEVEPHLGGDIKWIGEVDEIERNNLMSKAMCFLHPISWREPFGLTLTEAMACGCPVIAFGRGSIPELIQDGKTGYVVEDAEEMVEAIKRINKISRAYCRKYALSRFTPEHMAKAYLEVYNKLVGKEVTDNKKIKSSLPAGYLKRPTIQKPLGTA